MNNLSSRYFLSALALSLCFVSIAHASNACRVQKSAFDRANSDYTRTDAQYQNLQRQYDMKAEQAEYRRATLEGNVTQADANLKAAQTGAIGQGLGCLLAPRPTCLGPTVNQVAQRISRANAALKAARGRLDAFNRSTATQMTRLSQRITAQQELVNKKKAVLDQKEAAYNACMGVG